MATKQSTTEKGVSTGTSASQIEKLYRMIIDFSGQQGLVDRFYGDCVYSVPHPELSMNGGASQYAGGVVNPIAKYGYLTPANGTFITVHNDTSTGTGSIITTTQVDEVNSYAIFFNSIGIMNYTPTLISASYSAGTFTVSNAYGTDMAFYSVAGIRKLFFAYKNTNAVKGDIGVWDLHTLASGSVNGDQRFMGYVDNTYQLTGSIGNGTAAITSLSSTANLRIGMNVTATGVPTGAKIISIDSSTQVSISINATADETTIPFTFFPGIQTGDIITGGSSGATAIVAGDWNDESHDGTFFLEDISGNFSNGETITDQHSHSATVDTTINSSVLQNFMSAYAQELTPTGSVATVQGETFMSGNETRLIVADNGYMYILDGQFVHYYDGTINGSATGTPSAFGSIYYGVLEFPPQYTLGDGIDYRGKLWITLLNSNRDIYQNSSNTSLYSNYSGVYVWDRLTVGTATDDFVLIPGIREVRSIVIFNGTPTLFTVSSNRYTQIRMWNGSQFRVVQELGPESYPRFHDSISINGDVMTWLGNDGKVYSYGVITPGAKNALWMIGDLTTQSTGTYTAAGAILMVNGGLSTSSGFNPTPEAYYLSMFDNHPSTKTLQWYPHGENSISSNTQLASVGNYFSLVKPFPKLSQTHWLTLFYPPTGSGGSTTLLSVNIYINQNITPWNASPIPLTQDDAIRGYKTIPINITGVNFLQIGIVYPTNIGINLIPSLSYASIDYDQTTKLL